VSSSGDRGVGIKGWITGQKPQPKTAEVKPEPILQDRRRIAVLPFSNISPDPKDEYFADGMTEEAISTLSNISGLTVISRTSIMQFKRPKKNLSEIGRELKAGTILEGSVRKAGNQVRITVQLLDPVDDKHLWAQNYDRELQDVFEVQSDVAKSVADALKVRLLAHEETQIQKKPTDNIDAYVLYLQGRQHWNRRSEESLRKAIADFTQSLQNDPNLALAYVGLADCYTVMQDRGFVNPAEAAAKARPAILKALQLDETLAEAHAAYGNILTTFDWNWDSAEAEYKKAIKLNPNYATAHQWYSMLLGAEGRLEESLEEAKKAFALDLLAPMMSYNVGVSLVSLERYDEAIEYMNRSLAIEPNFGSALAILPFIYARKGEFDEAIAQQKANLAQPYYPKALAMTALAAIQAKAGKTEEALASLDAAMHQPDSGKIPPTWPAWVFAPLHDEDRAFEWLEKALKQHDPQLPYINGEPWFKDLSRRPRFQEILKKLGLDKYRR
jgi:TolB-like protein/Tfp pilus assembly protein PilF